ncbi:MAG: hypothetical protein ACMG51_05305 [Ginsengibacter sp.]
MEDFIYQTGYLKDKYFIFSNNMEIGNVFKTEWIGSNVEANIIGRPIKLIDKGFINPIITIVDKKTKEIIGSITISNLFKHYPSATLNLQNMDKYLWSSPQIFDNSWQWKNIATGQTTIKSKEPINIFKIKERSI